MSQQSIKASCKTNLPSLLQSTFPIWIYLPYWYLTSLLASNHHTNLFTSILYHYSYLTEEPSKPSCIFNLTSLPITPIYYPYLITNLLPLPDHQSNIPTCILSLHYSSHTHTHVHKLIMTDPDPILIDPNALEWHFSPYSYGQGVKARTLGRQNERNFCYESLALNSIFGFCFMSVCLIKSNCYSLIYSSLI